jgi:RNA polymerase sigma-70 factor, ECF subfamily
VIEAERDVSSIVQAARAAEPQLLLDEQAFAEFVREKAPSHAELAAMREHAGALWLTFGCVRGDHAALRRFDETMSPVLEAATRKVIGNKPAQDHLQALRERLLLGAKPLVAKYRGIGNLRRWLHVVCTREVLRRLDGEQRQPRSIPDEQVMARLVADDDPELSHVKQGLRAEVKRAFHDSFAELTPRDRTILKCDLVHELNLDGIARVVGVSRATAARHRNKARARLRQAVLRRLRERLAVDELDSVLGLVQSRLDLSLPRLLDDDG